MVVRDRGQTRITTLIEPRTGMRIVQRIGHQGPFTGNRVGVYIVQLLLDHRAIKTLADIGGGGKQPAHGPTAYP